MSSVPERTPAERPPHAPPCGADPPRVTPAAAGTLSIYPSAPHPPSSPLLAPPVVPRRVPAPDVLPSLACPPASPVHPPRQGLLRRAGAARLPRRAAPPAPVARGRAAPRDQGRRHEVVPDQIRGRRPQQGRPVSSPCWLRCLSRALVASGSRRRRRRPSLLCGAFLAPCRDARPEMAAAPELAGGRMAVPDVGAIVGGGGGARERARGASHRSRLV